MTSLSKPIGTNGGDVTSQKSHCMIISDSTGTVTEPLQASKCVCIAAYCGFFSKNGILGHRHFTIQMYK